MIVEIGLVLLGLVALWLYGRWEDWMRDRALVRLGMTEDFMRAVGQRMCSSVLSVGSSSVARRGRVSYWGMGIGWVVGAVVAGLLAMALHLSADTAFLFGTPFGSIGMFVGSVVGHRVGWWYSDQQLARRRVQMEWEWRGQ